ncbi:pre-60S factor rei1 [Podospora pseudocomata]|uniref:Pre-60S factor rei1 n=1 Tax=Podospora pseudocomata TaxID=2093779 RepID=A0ABR0GGP0_9PEZI|nr:pre-60S factor rei1 [Podospora pseudocomata]
MATISGSRAAPGAAPGADIGSSHPYTCNTCQVAFRNGDLQRGHMRSDWHRYNLKRRVASLPPISSEIFTEKVLQARAATTAQADKAGFERACEVCQKNYFSEGAYKNHLTSSKHKAKVAALAARPQGKIPDDASSMTFSLGEPAPTDSVVDSDAEEEFNEVVEGIKNTQLQENENVSPLRRPSNPHLSAAAQHKTEHPVSETPSEEEEESATPSSATPVVSQQQQAGPPRTINTCIFCNHESENPQLNAQHMEKTHGMFIPEKQYLVDLEGLINYLQERVYDLNECITCSKMRNTTYAVQTHMRDKAHVQIPFTTEDEQLEIGEFYDFRATYSDDEEGEWEDEDEEMEDADTNGGAKLGGHRATTTVTVDENGDEIMEDGNGEGWETDSDESSLNSDDLHAVPAELHLHQYERLSKNHHHSSSTPRTHQQADGFHAHSKKSHAVFYDDYELHLGSGKAVGHRSLNKYYRQNLYKYPTPEERAERLLLKANEQGQGVMDVDEDGNGQTVVPLRDPNPKARGRAVVGRDVAGLGVRSAGELEKHRAVVVKGKKQEWKDQKDRGMLQARLGIKEKAPHPATYLR